MLRNQRVICTLLAFLLMSPVFANQTNDKNKLSKIKQDIINLEKSIKGSGEKKGSLNSELKKSELESANINQKISALEKALKTLQTELVTLKKEQKNHEKINKY